MIAAPLGKVTLGRAGLAVSRKGARGLAPSFAPSGSSSMGSII